MEERIPAMETPWVPVKVVCHLYGMTYMSALNRIRKHAFPVSTYKVGKQHVIDKIVHEEYFKRLREAGLLKLKTTNG